MNIIKFKNFNESLQNINSDIEKLTRWIREYRDKSGSKGFVIGISGGVDSSAICGLVVNSVGKENVLGVLLPSIVGYKDDVDDGKRVAEHFGIKYVIRPIRNTVKTIIDEHDGDLSDLALSNKQARIRMTLLRMYAEINNYLVIGTTNLSEDMTGYFTKAGDGGHGVDLEPLANYYKSEVKEIAKFFNLPMDLVNRTPSAGLIDGITDEDELGFTYDDFENYWNWKIEKNGNCPVTQNIVYKIESLYNKTEHKRNLPPTYKR